MNYVIPLILLNLAQPQAKIEIEGGYSTFEVGKMVKLSASSSIGEAFSWMILPQIDGLEILNSGKRVLFATPKEDTYIFILAVGLDDYAPALTTQRIIIGRYEVESINKQPIRQIGRQSNLSRDIAGRISASFRQITGMLASGTITTKTQVVTTTASLIRKGLGEEAWNSTEVQTWLLSLRKILDKYDPQDMSEYQVLWTEIARNLEK